MKKIFILVILFIPLLAQAVIVTRVHPTTIAADKKILASDLNDEFNNLVTGVNNIDTTNITNGSLTATNFAATSTAVSINRRMGCHISNTPEGLDGQNYASNAIKIEPPCEIFMNGVSGYISATQTISLTSNLHDGSVGYSQYYYIYATQNSGSLTFQFSQTAPDLTTARRLNDSTARYIGTVRTYDGSSGGGSTANIAAFYGDGPDYYWSQNSAIFSSSGNQLYPPYQNLSATLTSSATNYSLSIPPTFEKVQLQYSAYVSGYPAECLFTATPWDKVIPAIVIATGGASGVAPFWIRPATYNAAATVGLFSAKSSNISNCSGGGNLLVTGWTEPLFLYQ